ncbi:MAG: hypothetical protein L6R40_004379 [Gallowayella cf. fulva]|nr:MAG: hypothetical protein L6R40_004379 [Xanthomendoza cf. fulva]
MKLSIIFAALCGMSAMGTNLLPRPLHKHHTPRTVNQPSRRSTGIYPRILYNRECNATGYGKFACVTCNDPTVKNELALPQDRWKAADGDNAWTQVTRWWTVLRNSGGSPLGSIKGFVPSLSWYWQGPEQWDCSNIGESFCSSVVKCTDADIPAAGMMLTAFANIHIFYDNFYTAIHDAGNSMQYQLSHFSKTFAPQGEDTLKALKLLLDILGISYGLIGAGVWNKILKDAPLFKDRGNDHGWAKDSANAAVASGVVIAKDAAPTLAGAVATQNDLTKILGTLVDGWAEVTATYVKQLFSGTDDAITQLGTYINGGAWYNSEIETSLFSLQGIMENVLYGQLIPKAWGDHAAVNPVVVYQSESNIENPLTKLFRGDAYRTLKTADVIKARTVSFVGFQLNGNKNGYVMPENSRFTDMNENAEYPYQAGIRTPGFFSIPVCNIDQVFDRTVRNRGNKNHNNQESALFIRS